MEIIRREIEHCEAEIEKWCERRKQLEDELTRCIRSKNTEDIYWTSVMRKGMWSSIADVTAEMKSMFHTIPYFTHR